MKSSLVIIFLVVFIDLLGFGIVIPILPYYASTYGASATALGWMMTAFSIMQFLFAPVWGRLSDRSGRRPVLIFSILGTAVSMLILGWAPTLFWLFIGRIFGGLCGANISTAMAYIADITPPQNRAKGMGMIGAAFGLGFIFGPAIGGVLSRYGYGAPIYFAAALSMFNAIFAYFRLEEPNLTPEMREANRNKRFDLGAFRETMSEPRTRIAILLFFVVTFAFVQMEVTFALFTRARFGYDAQTTGWLLALVGAIMVLVQGTLIGKLAKRFGELRLVIAGTLFMGIGLVLMAESFQIGIFLVAIAFVALGNAINNPSLSSLASQGAAPERRGVVMGFYQSAGTLSRILGPPLAGFLYDSISIGAPFLVAAVIMVFASVLGALQRCD